MTEHVHGSPVAQAHANIAAWALCDTLARSGVSRWEIARRLGISKTEVARHLKLHRRLAPAVKQALLAGAISEVEAEWLADTVVPWDDDHPLAAWLTREQLQRQLLETSSFLGRPKNYSLAKVCYDIWCRTDRDRSQYITSLVRLAPLGQQAAETARVALMLRWTLQKRNAPESVIEQSLERFRRGSLAQRGYGTSERINSSTAG
jgi:hypothetical protein